jgi:hypothetical protein
MIRSFNNISDSIVGDYDTSAFTSTAQTILNTITINPGDIKSGETFTVYAGFQKTGTSVYDIKLYYNTATTITGAFILGSVTAASGDTSPTFTRTLYPYAGDPTFIDSLTTTFNSYDDWGVYATSLSTTVLNNNIETNTGYFILTAQRTSVSTVALINNFFTVEI